MAPTASGKQQPLITTSVAMTERDFQLMSKFVENVCGIRMPPSKKSLLESRLQKRLRRLEMQSFRDYYQFLISPDGMRDELVDMIDVITTNKTDFFREASHFSCLTEKILPILDRNRTSAGISVWSAGCSSGEEPYTLAMVLSEYGRNHPGFTYSILATDICTSVLETARLGVYEEEKIAPVPLELRKRYLLRSKNPGKGVVRICPELRQKICFRRLNFMDERFDTVGQMQIIFCRNVIIYFDRETQERLLRKFCSHLVTGGYLFMGHSETLNGLDLPLVQVSSTVYRKQS